MSRVALVVITVLVSCTSGEGDRPPGRPLAQGERVAVPGGGPATATSRESRGAIDRFHLEPEEGTVAIEPQDGSAGTEQTARIAVVPGASYHVATDYPASLKLVAPAGVTLARTDFAAGKGAKGDAEAFSEQTLAFAVKATAAKPGTYEIGGTFDFAVCQTSDSCHMKKLPITIRLAAR